MATAKKKVTKGDVKTETVKPVSKWVRIPRHIHEQVIEAERALMGEKVKQNAKLIQAESQLATAKDKLALIEAILSDKKLEALQMVFKKPAEFTIKTEWIDATPKDGTTYVFTPHEFVAYAK